MALRDSSIRYGSFTSLLHWLITVLVLFMLGLGWFMATLPDKSDLRHQLVGFHISTGVVVLALALVFIIWRASGVRPSMGDLPVWQRILARITHLCLFAILVVQPALGIIMATAGGHHVNVYGWFQLPLFLPESKALAGAAHNVHVWLPWFIAAAIALHVLAALYHHFVRRDHVLRRIMAPNTSAES